MFLPAPVDGRVGCFQLWVVMRTATVHIWVQVLVWTRVLISLGTGLWGHMVRNQQTVPHGGRATSRPHQQRARVPVAPRPRQHLLLSVCLI